MDFSSKAFRMAFHGAELKAFFISSVSTPILFLGPLASTMLLSVYTASVVDRPLRKPNCLSSIPLFESRKFLRRLSRIFSNSFPRQSRMHSGLYEDG